LLFIELAQTESAAVRLAFFIAAAWLVAPVGRWRALAVAPLFFGLWHLTRLETMSMAFRITVFGCALLLVGTVAWPARGVRASVAPFDGRDLVAFATVGCLGLGVVASLVGVRVLAQSTDSLLSNIGLDSSIASGRTAAAEPISLAFAADGEAGLLYAAADSNSPRLNILLNLLTESTPASEPVRKRVLRGFVVAYCRADRSRGVFQPDRSLLLRRGSDERLLAHFRCGRRGEAPEFAGVPARATRQGSEARG
jgi:hypothetical protein